MAFLKPDHVGNRIVISVCNVAAVLLIATGISIVLFAGIQKFLIIEGTQQELSDAAAAPMLALEGAAAIAFGIIVRSLTRSYVKKKLS